MSDTANGQQHDELTGGEAAQLLGVSRQRVNQLAHDGKIPARQIAGRYWIFRRADVEAHKLKEKSKGGHHTHKPRTTKPA